MAKRSKRVNPLVGIMIGLTATKTEARTILRFRREQHDHGRAGMATTKFKRLIAVYDALRNTPGVWLCRSDIARIGNISERHARRLIAVFETFDDARFEIDYTKKGKRQQSRLRFIGEI